MNFNNDNYFTKILLVDDHAILRQGIAMILGKQDDIKIVADLGSGEEALNYLKTNTPDIALIDIGLKDINGLELTEKIVTNYPNIPVLILSMQDEVDYCNKVLRSGAKGYIMKDEVAEKLTNAIKTVVDGNYYMSQRLMDYIIHQYIKYVSSPSCSKISIELLTDREAEIFNLIGNGMNTKQISTDLHISIKTVETHKYNIKDKLKLDNSMQLYQCARDWSYMTKTN
jgi:DNA-binding NarL/FixJ family response regulator